MPETREWSNERWQLDQAVLDAEMLPRSVEQIARLESMRDSWDQMAADAQLGAALRAALAAMGHADELQIFVYRATGKPPEYEVGIEHYQSYSEETDATRLLAVLLAGAPRTETP